MKIKRIWIVMSLLLLTGCTVNYDLNINDNGIFIETITGTVTNEELDNEGRTDVNDYLYNMNYSTPLIRDEGTYNKDIVDRDGYKEFRYTYTFRNNYEDSSAVNNCYEDVTFEKNADLYYIKLGGKFSCLYSDKVIINVTCDNVVIDNNADKINGNTYTWEITSENDDIYMVISRNDKKENEQGGISVFKIVGFVVLVVLSVVTYFLYKKKNGDEK